MFADKPEFVSAAHDATNFLTELPAMADAFSRVFQGKYGLSFTVIAVFLVSWYFLFKANPSGLLAYHQTRRRSRFEALEKYLSEAEARDQSCVQTVREIYDAECFEQATGIYAERTKRAGLISLYSKVNGIASWRTIRTAEDFLEFDERGTATVRPFNRLDRITHRFHMICAKGTICIGTLAFLVIFLSPGNRLLGFFEGLGVYLLFLVFGGFLLRETMPYQCAEKIRTRLESNRDPAGPVLPADSADVDPAAAGISNP